MFTAVAAFAVLTLALLGLATWKYRSPLHPLLYPLVQLLVQAAAAPLAQAALFGLRQTEAVLAATSWLTSAYVLAFAAPFLVDWNPLRGVLRDLFRGLALPRWGYRLPGLLGALGLAVVAGLAFALLVRDSPEGGLWLTNPRLAYMTGRAGVGHWYVPAQACLGLALIVALDALRVRRIAAVAGLTLAAATLALWFGSKAGVVGVLAAGGLYANFYVRPLRTVEMCGAALIGVPAVLASPWLQGNFDSLLGSLAYYDYFENAAIYLSRAERLGPRYGDAWTTSFWEYVPRGVYPGKPFIYGVLFINEYFWPGAAEQGHTPALLPWVVWHLDFGLAGVVLGGLAAGFLAKGIYLEFLATRSLAAFLAYVQICFIPVVKHVPLLYFAVCLAVLIWSLQALTLGVRTACSVRHAA